MLINNKFFYFFIEVVDECITIEITVFIISFIIFVNIFFKKIVFFFIVIAFVSL